MRMMAMALLVSLTFAGTAAAQDDVLLAVDFEDGPGDFMTMDSQAVLSVTNDPDEVYGGNGSLDLTYPQRAMDPGGMDGEIPGTAMLPLGPPVPTLAAISFAAWSAEPTALMVVMTEIENGPRYNRVVWCEAGGWHEFELGIDEFSRDLNGPEDPDGELSPELIVAIGFVDVGGFLRFLAEMTPMISIADPVDQTLRFDDIKLLSTSPVPPVPEEGLIPICDYDEPKGFIVLGGTGVVVVPEEADDGGNALTCHYQVPPHTVFGVYHDVSLGKLAGATEIRVQVACTADTTLVITLEEHRDGESDSKAKYTAFRQISAYEPVEELVFPVSDFKLNDGARDANGQLDMDLVKSVAIADVSAFVSGEEVSNTLLLDELVAAQ